MTLIDHPSPNHSPRHMRVDTIIIHHTVTTSDEKGTRSAVGWLSQKASKVSAHYVIGHDGKVYRLVPEERAAKHAGLGRLPWETLKPYDFNHRSIGIELVNPGDGVTPFTEAQYRALGELLPDIVRRWGDGRPAFTLPRGEEAVAGWMGTAMKLIRDGRFVILGHRDVAPGRKTDPADNFDWGRVRSLFAGRVA